MAVAILLLALGACATEEAEPMDPGEILAADRSADPVKLGRQLIDQRETPGSLDRAITLLEWHAKEHPEVVEVRLLAAEAHARACDLLDNTKSDQKKRHQQHQTQGRFHASSAVSRSPENGPAHYWFGACLLFAADDEQSYSRLKEALAELTRAEKLDPKVDEGGPARMIGRIYQETPGGFLLGSRPKAMEWYHKSIGVSPNFPLTHLWLAETLAKDSKSKEAHAEIDIVLKAHPVPGHEKELADVKAKADALLKTLKP
jgi:tetratricopeptide (TPR) repeat protein